MTILKRVPARTLYRVFSRIVRARRRPLDGGWDVGPGDYARMNAAMTLATELKRRGWSPAPSDFGYFYG